MHHNGTPLCRARAPLRHRLVIGYLFEALLLTHPSNSGGFRLHGNNLLLCSRSHNHLHPAPHLLVRFVGLRMLVIPLLLLADRMLTFLP